MEKTYICNSKVRAFESTIKELFDSREGVVMDSLYGIDKNGAEFVALDTYETSMTSGLTVYTGTEKELAEVWNEFTSAYDSEYGEE
jgi:hypothetical protein